ncbi:MAG: ATP-grasp domain-containing protein [Gemmatimonadaceae bacterium]
MSTPIRVALATAARLSGLTADDRILLDELRSRGVAAEPVVWDAPCDWSQFDAAIIRSCWDSHLKRDAFLAWVAHLTDIGVYLFNSAPLIAWNMDKRYLRELSARGVAVVPTEWAGSDASAGNDLAPQSPAPRLHDVLSINGWAEAVVKPAVSAGAYETWRTTRATAASDQTRLDALLNDHTGVVMIQPFMDEVVEQGEWSLIFVAGSFSHAVLKRPATDDFRVQETHGGSTDAVDAPVRLIDDAAAVLSAAAEATGMLPHDVLYARVDGIVQDDRLVLMELECVEPTLFFEYAPNAAAYVSDALLNRVAPLWCGSPSGDIF